jgi:ribosomal protein L24
MHAGKVVSVLEKNVAVAVEQLSVQSNQDPHHSGEARTNSMTHKRESAATENIKRGKSATLSET